METLIDWDKLDELIKAAHQHPAGTRLMQYGINCLVKDGWSKEGLLTQINNLPIDKQWTFVRQRLKESRILSLIDHLTTMASEIEKAEIDSCGYQVGDKAKYKGNNSMYGNLLTGKTLTVESIQRHAGELWATCSVPGGLSQTVKLTKLQKIYKSS
jgi:hypothetical protein